MHGGSVAQWEITVMRGSIDNSHASRAFYGHRLGPRMVAERHRAPRQSFELDRALPSDEQIELFSLRSPPPRPSRPEARGLRHLVFVVDDIALAKPWLVSQGIAVGPVRVDEYTGRRPPFFADPDGLPPELHDTSYPTP